MKIQDYERHRGRDHGLRTVLSILIVTALLPLLIPLLAIVALIVAILEIPHFRRQ